MDFIAHEAPLSMDFSRQECWSGLPFPPSGDRPGLGIVPSSLLSPALVGGFLTTLPPLLTIITSLALNLTNTFPVIEWRDFPTGDSHLQEALANGTWHAVGTYSLFVRQVLRFVHTQTRSLVRVYSVICIPAPLHPLDCGLRLPNLASWLWPSVQSTQKTWSKTWTQSSFVYNPARQYTE